jgi:hypothetical protein
MGWKIVPRLQEGAPLVLVLVPAVLVVAVLLVPTSGTHCWQDPPHACDAASGVA